MERLREQHRCSPMTRGNKSEQENTELPDCNTFRCIFFFFFFFFSFHSYLQLNNILLCLCHICRFRNWWLSFRMHPRMVSCFCKSMKHSFKPLCLQDFVFLLSPCFAGVSCVLQKQKRRFWQIWPTSPMILTTISSCARYGPGNFLCMK